MKIILNHPVWSEQNKSITDHDDDDDDDVNDHDDDEEDDNFLLWCH